MEQRHFPRAHGHAPSEADAATHYGADAERLRTLGILAADGRPPWDIIGDVHGCVDELRELLECLGYVPEGEGYRHSEGRRAVFVGDLVDRGPAVVAVLRAALAMHDAGSALVVIGNHDDKFLRWLRGHHVRIKYGLADTIVELQALPPAERAELSRRADDLFSRAPGYLILDDSHLIVTHGAIRDSMIGRWSQSIASFCLYGDVAGYTEGDKPIRRDWGAARDLSAAGGGDAPLIVYGHNVVARPVWVNRTLDIDTGCVYGGALTALRYPELEIVHVPARREYSIRGA
jgi:protein phosphatase